MFSCYIVGAESEWNLFYIVINYSKYRKAAAMKIILAILIFHKQIEIYLIVSINERGLCGSYITLHNCPRLPERSVGNIVRRLLELYTRYGRNFLTESTRKFKIANQYHLLAIVYVFTVNAKRPLSNKRLTLINAIPTQRGSLLDILGINNKH